VAVLVPLLLAGVAGCAGLSKTSSISVNEFRDKIVGKVFKPKKFYEIYGDPDRISEIGNVTSHYYACNN
jgi:hypothetical protein